MIQLYYFKTQLKSWATSVSLSMDSTNSKTGLVPRDETMWNGHKFFTQKQEQDPASCPTA